MSASSGTVTLANIRLSLVAGTAFVDFSSAGTLSYPNYRLVLTDSAGKKAVGFIKAAGSSETLDSELVTNGTFAVDGTWTKGAGWAIGSGTGNWTSGSGAGSLYQGGITNQTGKLYKLVYDITAIGASTSIRFAPGGVQYGSLRTATGTSLTDYLVGTDAWNGNMVFSPSNNTSVSVDNASVKQVLTPSATGVTITSTPNGTTYNWASIESGFNYNDSAGYSYTIYAVPRRRSKWNAQYNYFYRRNK